MKIKFHVALHKAVLSLPLLFLLFSLNVSD